MRLEVQGFQIIKHGLIEPSGITMIVGNTNNGKSSFLRAVVGALFGAPGTDYINWDIGQCAVQVNLDQDENYPPCHVVWAKNSEGKQRYIIDGVALDKTGRTGPSDILASKGIGEVVVRKNRENVLYWQQLSEPFLILRSETYIFEFLSSLMEDRKIFPVLKKMSEDGRQLRQDTQSLEGSITAFRSTITLLESKDQKLSTILNYEQDFWAIRKDIQKYQRYSDYSSSLQMLDGNLAQVEPHINNYALVLNQVKDLNVIGDDLDLLEESKLIVTQLESYDFEISRLDKVLSKIKLDDSDFPDLSKDLLRIGDYRSLFNDLASLDQKLSLIDSQIISARDQLLQANVAISEFQDKIGVCPLCNRSFNDGKCDDSKH